MKMKKAVIYGAGNIGRGFIAPVFAGAGYAVTFIDVNMEVVDAINKSGSYYIDIVGENAKRQLVEHVFAVDGRDNIKVAETIAGCETMACCVGANILKFIVPNIVNALKLKLERDKNATLDLLICENLMNADEKIRHIIIDTIGKEEYERLSPHLGLVETSIGRMVPVIPPEERTDPLMVRVESYDRLPVDRDAFKGAIPHIENLVPYSPFSFYLKRKLYIHNMGHAVCGYLAEGTEHTTIASAINDERIRTVTRDAMMESAKALSAAYSYSFDELNAHVEDLLHRFGNVKLGDTVKRIINDPVRKLQRDDRLVGAAYMCIENGIEPVNICKGIKYAVKYYLTEQGKAVTDESIRECLTGVCGIGENDAVCTLVLKG